MKWLINISLLLIALTGFSQSDEKVIFNEGMEAYNKGNYTKALERFEAAYAKNNKYNKALYNAANAAYRTGDFKKASDLYDMYAASLETKNERAKAYHNLGNAHLKQKEYGEAVNAYKKSLRNNPNDKDTRYNLSYALSKLKKQQQQKKK